MVSAQTDSLLEKVGKDYPTFETMTEQSVTLALGPEGPLPQFAAPALRLKFQHVEKPFVLQFWKERFSMNALKPYPGWNALRDEFTSVWPRISEVLRPSEVTRIGMRYINRIKRGDAEEKPGQYIKENRFIPSVLIDSGPDFMSRVESRIDQNNRLFMTIAHDKNNKEESYGSLVIDIDRVCDSKIATGTPEILTTLQKLHDDIWDVFESSKNDNYDALLEKGGI